MNSKVSFPVQFTNNLALNRIFSVTVPDPSSTAEKEKKRSVAMQDYVL